MKIYPTNKFEFSFSYDLKFSHTFSILYSELGIFEIHNDRISKITEDKNKIFQQDSFIFDNSTYLYQPVLSQLPTVYSLLVIHVYKTDLPQIKSTMFVHKIQNYPDSFFFETKLSPNQFIHLFHSFVQ